MATPRVAAGVIFRDPRGRVLFVKPSYKSGWDVPGGYVEPDESPRAAALREVQEELGVTVEPGRLLVVDWAPHTVEGDKLLFLFDGGYVNAERATLQADEIKQATYHEPEQLDQLMPERLARRVRYALQELEHASDTYLEHGRTALPESVSMPSTDE